MDSKIYIKEWDFKKEVAFMSKVKFEMKLNDIAYWRVPPVQMLKIEERSMTKGKMILLVDIFCVTEINNTGVFIEKSLDWSESKK